MSQVPDTADVLLTRQRVAEALTAAGYPISHRTLATKATRGGGPPYSLFSGRAIYRWGNALHRLPEVLARLLPGGRMIGPEWHAGSLRGEPNHDVSVAAGLAALPAPQSRRSKRVMDLRRA